MPVSRTYVTLINLHLRRGSPDDAASLLANMGEHHRVPENFVRKVREATEGEARLSFIVADIGSR